MKDLAPIAVFVYNRPKHTAQMLKSLLQNKILSESEIYFFSDAAKKAEHEEDVRLVREVIHNFKGAAKVHVVEQVKNKGLAKSIIDGVSSILESHQQVIVLEDDLLLSNDLLDFFNEGLNFHKSSSNIFSLSGYTPDIAIPKNYAHDTYIAPRISSWGWATWKDRWGKVDWSVSDFAAFIHDNQAIAKHDLGGQDATAMLVNQMTGKIDSWAIRFNYACFKNNAGCVFPCITKVLNNGADGSGTHVKSTDKYNTTVSNKKVNFSALRPNDEIQQNFRRFFKSGLLRQLINLYKRTRARRLFKNN